MGRCTDRWMDRSRNQSISKSNIRKSIDCRSRKKIVDQKMKHNTYGLDCLPKNKFQVLIPGTCECNLVWKLYNQVKMRSYRISVGPNPTACCFCKNRDHTKRDHSPVGQETETGVKLPGQCMPGATINRKRQIRFSLSKGMVWLTSLFLTFNLQNKRINLLI